MASEKKKSTVGQILTVQRFIEDVRAKNLQSVLLLTAKERVKNDSFCSEKDRYAAHIQRVTVIVLVASKNKQHFKLFTVRYNVKLLLRLLDLISHVVHQ